MDTAWTWELSGYCAKYSFLTEPRGVYTYIYYASFSLTPNRLSGET